MAELAWGHRLPVAAHVGDMMQIHQHVAIAHPGNQWLEHIPWLRECFQEPATVGQGEFQIPQAPGASTTLRGDALERFGVR